MYRSFVLAIVITFVAAFQAYAVESGAMPFAHGRLRVDKSQRYLCHEDGTPFLYLGDTAWELFARLTTDEATTYLENRRLKGFSVIQAVIYTELDDTLPSIGVPQRVEGDITHIHPRYLQHIDSVIDIAASKGLYIALVPTWGDKVDKQWGKGPVLFDASNAREYGRMLGKHYATRPNIIWVIGGDRGGEGSNKVVWSAMAEGIKEYDNNHLMTYHPHGEHSSSFWFHNEKWLDFNMFQSGHCQDSYEIYRRLLIPDYNRQPVKPVMDGEPRYENIPYQFNPRNRRFDDYDVRKSLYQSMLSGACGYTYGCNDIWQMYAPGYEAKCDANRYWYFSLDASGASQLVFFRRLWLAFPFVGAVPLKDVIKPTCDYEGDAAVAFGNDTFILCYFPEGMMWQISLPDIWQGETYVLKWFSPVTGLVYEAGVDNRTHFEVNVPSADTHRDWVLIIKK